MMCVWKVVEQRRARKNMSHHEPTTTPASQTTQKVRHIGKHAMDGWMDEWMERMVQYNKQTQIYQLV